MCVSVCFPPDCGVAELAGASTLSIKNTDVQNNNHKKKNMAGEGVDEGC